MKTKSRIMRSLMALAIAFIAVAMLGGVNAQAAKRKCTFKYDSKKGVVWEPTVRVVSRDYNWFWSNGTKDDVKDDNKTTSKSYKNPLYFNSYYNTTMWVAADGAKVSVKSSSSNLMVKTSYQYGFKRGSDDYYNWRVNPYSTLSYYDDDSDQTVYQMPSLKDKKFSSCFGIEMFAKEAGTYHVTVTVKKGKKKLVTKKIKVIALDSAPLTAKYGGVESGAGAIMSLSQEDGDIWGPYSSYGYGGSIYTDKKSGKLKIKANKTYKVKKVEVGKYINTTYDSEKDKVSPENVKYRTIKNGAKIKLETNKKHTGISKYSSSVSTTKYDYMFPVTLVRVTYVDTLFGIEGTDSFSIVYNK